MQQWPTVTIIVLNWNGEKNTIECLESLRTIDYPNYEIVVIDNASEERLGDLTCLSPRITQIENKENQGFGGGFNVGIRIAQSMNADYVFCLNNDIIVDTNILREMVKIGESDSRIGALCPIEYYYHNRKLVNCAGGTVNIFRSKVIGHNKIDHGQFNKVRQTFLLSGPAMMFKLPAVLDIGLFDTDYFFGPEDQDVAIKLNKKGYLMIFVPKAKIWHKGKGATGGTVTPLNIYFSVRNRITFAKKHAGLIEFIIFLLYFSIVDLPLTFLRCVRSLEPSKCINAAFAGIIWHLDSRLFPIDCKIVNLLYQRKFTTNWF